MKSNDIRKILWSDPVEIPVEAMRETKRRAIIEAEASEEAGRRERSFTQINPLRSATGAFAVNLAAAVLVIALGLTVILSSARKTSPAASLLFSVAYAETAEDGNREFLTQPVDKELSAELPIKTKLSLLRAPSAKDSDAILRQARINAEQAVDLKRTPYTTYGLYGSVAMAYASDSILSFGVEDAENVESVTVICGKNGYFELSSGDFAHRRRYRRSFRYGNRVELSGESFKELYLLEGEETSALTVWWRPSTAVAQAFEANLSMRLSSIADTLVVEVRYKNGSIRGSAIELKFDDDGVLHAKAISQASVNNSLFRESAEASAPPEDEKCSFTGEPTSLFAPLDVKSPDLILQEELMLPPVWTGCFDDGCLAVVSYFSSSIDELDDDLKLALIPQNDVLLGLAYPENMRFMQLLFFDVETGAVNSIKLIPAAYQAQNLKIYGDTLYLIERTEGASPTRVLRYSNKGEFIGATVCSEETTENEVYTGECSAVFDTASHRAIVSEMVEINDVLYVKRSELDLETGEKTRLSLVGYDMLFSIMQPIAFYGKNRLETKRIGSPFEVLDQNMEWSLIDGESGAYPVEADSSKQGNFYRILDARSGKKLLMSDYGYGYSFTDAYDSNANDEKVLLIDLENCSTTEMVFDTRYESGTASISSSGKTIVTYSFKQNEDLSTQEVVRLYNAETNELIDGFALPEDYNILFPNIAFAVDDENGMLFISAVKMENGVGSDSAILSYSFGNN